jgi:hypothetical protein
MKACIDWAFNKSTTNFSHTNKIQLGENMVKGTRGAKVKVFFQGLHMTCVILLLVYNFRFCISGTPFNIAF